MTDNADRTKMFPMQNGPPIPWELAEHIYEKGYKVLYGSSGNSFEHIAFYRGFTWEEVSFITDQLRKRDPDAYQAFVTFPPEEVK